MSQACFYCGEPIADPNDRSVHRQMIGWEHRSTKTSSRRGGSDIVMREPTGKVAHATCIDRVKRGIDPGQGSLL